MWFSYCLRKDVLFVLLKLLDVCLRLRFPVSVVPAASVVPVNENTRFGQPPLLLGQGWLLPVVNVKLTVVQLTVVGCVSPLVDPEARVTLPVQGDANGMVPVRFVPL